MAVEWRESDNRAYAEIGEILSLRAAQEFGGLNASIVGADGVIWREDGFDTLGAAKSAALAEARRLLAQALEELGDG